MTFFQHETITANGINHPIDYRTEDYVQAVKKYVFPILVVSFNEKRG